MKNVRVDLPADQGQHPAASYRTTKTPTAESCLGKYHLNQALFILLTFMFLFSYQISLLPPPPLTRCLDKTII